MAVRRTEQECIRHWRNKVRLPPTKLTGKQQHVMENIGKTERMQVHGRVQQSAGIAQQVQMSRHDQGYSCMDPGKQGTSATAAVGVSSMHGLHPPGIRLKGGRGMPGRGAEAKRSRPGVRT